MQRILFAGAGSMAEAMIHGLLKKGGITPDQLYVMNKSDHEKLTILQDQYGVQLVDEKRDVLQTVDLIILAMKPKDVRKGMEDLAPYLRQDTAILSVIAGVPIKTIVDGLGNRPIARAMPNTSAAIGMSASAVAWNEMISIEQREEILTLLSAIGTVQEVKEDSLHMVTALSGSGPAYIYFLVEAFEQAAVTNGLPLDIARPLIIQTLSGAAEMLKNQDHEPSQLRKNVTSPGGTTEAGLQALTDYGFYESIGMCIQKANERSRELGNSY